MHHNREDVIERAIREFELLEHLVASLPDEDWGRAMPRKRWRKSFLGE